MAAEQLGAEGTALAVHDRKRQPEASRLPRAARSTRSPVRSASVPLSQTSSASRTTAEAGESPPFTPPRGFAAALQVSETTCKIAPSIGEWAALQNGRHDKLLRRRLTRHATTSRQTVQLQLEKDQLPARQRRRKQRERQTAPRAESADGCASLDGAPVLPPLSFADTMRFGHGLSVALAGKKANGPPNFEDAVELDAAAIEAAEGDLLVDLICSAAVSSAIDGAINDRCGVVDAVTPLKRVTVSAAEKPAATLHVNSTLGATLGGQGGDPPQPLGKTPPFPALDGRPLCVCVCVCVYVCR